jgi:acyl carrier protein
MIEIKISDIQGFICEYIRSHIPGENQAVNENTNFVANELLDSFAILSLIMTLESQYSVKFQPEELADPTLHIVGNISQAVCKKLLKV